MTPLPINSTQIEINELSLISLLQLKSTPALTALYERYSTILYQYICKLVKDDHFAEDILQESFVKIWRNAERFDAAKGSLFTWMLNICKNTAVDKMRSKSYKMKQRTAGEKAIDTNNRYASTYTKTDTIGIKEVVNKLRPEFGAIINLVYLNGFTHREAAVELKIPVGTLKTRLRCAMVCLRQLV